MCDGDEDSPSQIVVGRDGMSGTAGAAAGLPFGVTEAPVYAINVLPEVSRLDVRGLFDMLSKLKSGN